jgi:hypothetical protein
VDNSTRRDGFSFLTHRSTSPELVKSDVMGKVEAAGRKSAGRKPNKAYRKREHLSEEEDRLFAARPGSD